MRIDYQLHFASMSRIRRAVVRPASALLLVAATQAALAAGFFVDQQSVRGLGRVNAGVAAAADDPSTIFFNPAGLANLWHDDRPGAMANLGYGGVQLIIPRSTLINSGSTAATPGTLTFALPYSGTDLSNPSNPTPVFNVYYARRLDGDNGYVGLGIGSPFGLATKFNSDWFGRYDAIEASLLTVNISGVVAYRLNSSTAIGGIDLQYAKTKLVTAIPNPLTSGGPTAATDGQVKTEGTAWTPGFNIGLLIGLDGPTRIGLDYRSKMDHRVSGDATTSNLTGPLAPANGTVGASATLKLPAIASLGIAHEATSQVSLYAQIEWYGWGSFDQIRVSFDDGRPDAVRTTNYRNTWAAAVGGDYRASDAITVRGGLRYDRTPTVNGFRDTTFPDADRMWLGLGLSYRLSDTSTVDVAFNQVFFRNAAIDITREFFGGSPLVSTVRVFGNADSRVNTVSIGYAKAF